VLVYKSLHTEASTLWYFQQLEHFTLIVTVAQSVFPSLPITQYLTLSVQDLVQLAGFL
jgi:hypothetical protein